MKDSSAHAIRGVRGSVIMLTLVVVTFAVLLVGGLLRFSAAGKGMAAKEYQNAQGYYVAETGLMTAITSTEARRSIHTQIFEQGLASASLSGEVVNTETAQVAGEYEVTVTHASGDTYLFEALGRTPYSTQMASAHVRLVPFEAALDGANFYLGDTVVNLTFFNNAGTGQSSEPAMWHFADGDFQLLGSLDASAHNRRTFNIWNGRIRGEQNPTDFVAAHPWLHSKYEEGTWGDMPDIVGALEDMINTLVGREEFISVSRDPSPNSSRLSAYGGTAGSPLPMKARYTGTLGSQIEIQAAGVLEIIPTSNSVVIGRLELKGDLVLLPTTNISIAEFVSNGHRLLLLSEHNVTFAANPASDGSSNFKPFPFHANNRTYEILLGHGSVIVAKGDVVVEGQLRPDTELSRSILDSGLATEWYYVTEDEPPPQKDWIAVPRHMPEVDVSNWGEGGEFDGTRETAEALLLSPGVDASRSYDPVLIAPLGDPGDPGYDPGWGSLAIVSKEGAIRFHLLMTRGIVYAGSQILGYRLRLDGFCYIEDPRSPDRPDNALGLAECFITGSPLDALFDIGVPPMSVQLLQRLR